MSESDKERADEQKPQAAQPTQIEIQTEDEPQSPYRNMWVPLLVVPALIAMVLVLVASFFQLLSTDQKSPQQNLELMLNGGINERQQATFELVRQILEYQHASMDDREVEWDIDASFLTLLSAERAKLPAPTTTKEVSSAFVLSSLLAELGDAGGVRQLVETTRLSEELDPGALYRMNSIFVLGSIGRELPEPERLLVAERMIAVLEGEDEGLAGLAAGALQSLPSPGTVPALVSLLGHRRADLRLQAALSLAELGDPSGVPVLLELVPLTLYLREREAFPDRWLPQIVSATREKVLEALAKLDRLPEEAELRALAESDPDPNFKSKVLTLLGRGTPKGEG